LLAVGAVLARRSADTDDARGRSAVRVAALVGAATLVAGLTLSYIAGSTYQVRYAAVVFPFVVMVAAFGVTIVTNVKVRVLVLAVAAVLGLVGGWRIVRTERTQAGQVAAEIVRNAHRGDVLGYCPDQLGPAVSRLLPDSLGIRQVTFPTTSSPQRVDWVDYADTVERAAPEQFATALVNQAGASSVWLVSSAGYRPFDRKCESVLAGLTSARGPGQTLVEASPHIFEHMSVVRFDR